MWHVFASDPATGKREFIWLETAEELRTFVNKALELDYFNVAIITPKGDIIGAMGHVYRLVRA